MIGYVQKTCFVNILVQSNFLLAKIPNRIFSETIVFVFTFE